MAEHPWTKLFQGTFPRRLSVKQAPPRKLLPRRAICFFWRAILGAAFLEELSWKKGFLETTSWRSLAQGGSAKKAPPRRPLPRPALGLALGMGLGLAQVLGLALSLALHGRALLDERSWRMLRRSLLEEHSQRRLSQEGSSKKAPPWPDARPGLGHGLGHGSDPWFGAANGTGPGGM